MLEPTTVKRGEASSRVTAGEFSFKAQAVIVTAGGNRRPIMIWYVRTGLLVWVRRQKICSQAYRPHVDGRMVLISQQGRWGGLLTPTVCGHYTEGIQKLEPDLAPSWYPYSAGAIFVVVRCQGPPAAGTALSRL